MWPRGSGLGLRFGQLFQDFFENFVFRHAFGLTLEAAQNAVAQRRQGREAYVVDRRGEDKL
jgi:hypothetical protein